MFPALAVGRRGCGAAARGWWQLRGPPRVACEAAWCLYLEECSESLGSWRSGYGLFAASCSIWMVPCNPWKARGRGHRPGAGARSHRCAPLCTAGSGRARDSHSSVISRPRRDACESIRYGGDPSCSSCPVTRVTEPPVTRGREASGSGLAPLTSFVCLFRSCVGGGSHVVQGRDTAYACA